MAEKKVFRDFQPLGFRSAKTENIQKLRNFGENLWGSRIFLPKVPLEPGNCIFLFSARARNFSKCPRPERAEIPLNHRFRPVGPGPTKTVVPEKVVGNHPPDSVVTFCSRFGTPVALGPEKGPKGLVACLLLAC